MTSHSIRSARDPLRAVIVVLDGAGLQAWAQRIPPRQLLAVMEVLRRSGAGRVLVPSVVTVEALTGDARDAPINQALKQVGVDEMLPLDRTRTAARLRRATTTSAVDPVVAGAAARTRAAFLVTSDPDDMTVLLEHVAPEGPVSWGGGLGQSLSRRASRGRARGRVRARR